MKISEIMSRNVECIEPDTSIKDAAEKMRSIDVGFLPVCEDGHIIGTLTDRDITIRHVADGQNPYRVKARDILTPNVFYCFEDQDTARRSPAHSDLRSHRTTGWHCVPRGYLQGCR